MNIATPRFAQILACGLLTTLLVQADPPKRQQAQIKGLLVIQLPNGSFAGTASQMNATVVPASSDAINTFHIRFNQEVGEMMEAATQEVEKLMRVRHSKSLPTGHRIEFGFADKHSLKDGPSAAVACALMAESIITGDKLDQSFAVTGDLTATGEVRPIGGVGAKVRGATNRDCKIMCVPSANKAAIDDIYVLDGIAPIAETQVILIENFDQAWLVAKAQRPVEIEQALKDYEMVQTAITHNADNASHPKVLNKLKSILKTIPNHESARLIALHGMGKGPKNLSLAGSLAAIQKAANQLSGTMKNGSYVDRGMKDPLWNNVALLTRLRGDVDPRTKDYLDAFLETAMFIKEIRGRKQWTSTLDREFRTAIKRIRSEEQAILNDSKLQEELMTQ